MLSIIAASVQLVLLLLAALYAFFPSLLGISDDDPNSKPEWQPKNYWESRARFRAEARESSVELHSLQLKLSNEQKTMLKLCAKDRPVDADSLTIDVAILRPKGATSTSDATQGLCVHQSGLHGNESAAGAAVQLKFIREWRGSSKEAFQNVTIVIVHALNPYGWAVNRRWNEENVDLNRNQLSTKQQWGDLLASTNQAYVNLDPVMNPGPELAEQTSFCGAWSAWLGFWAAAAPRIVLHGIRALTVAALEAQHCNERGVYFTGRRMQQSHLLVRKLLREQINLAVKRRVVVGECYYYYTKYCASSVLLLWNMGGCTVF
jgi:hypothetical protein